MFVGEEYCWQKLVRVMKLNRYVHNAFFNSVQSAVLSTRLYEGPIKSKDRQILYTYFIYIYILYILYILNEVNSKLQTSDFVSTFVFVPVLNSNSHKFPIRQKITFVVAFNIY